MPGACCEEVAWSGPQQVMGGQTVMAILGMCMLPLLAVVMLIDVLLRMVVRRPGASRCSGAAALLVRRVRNMRRRRLHRGAWSLWWTWCQSKSISVLSILQYLLLFGSGCSLLACIEMPNQLQTGSEN